MKVNPIKPSDVTAMKIQTWPGEVIEAFNEMIVRHYLNGTASFRQSVVVKLMVEKGLNEDQIFNERWLDVESIYMANGWDVVYDRPGYNESYEPTFTFKVKR